MRESAGKGCEIVAFAAADIDEEDIAVRGVEPGYEARDDGVEVWLKPHCVAGAVGLHEVVEVAGLGWVCTEPWKEV